MSYSDLQQQPIAMFDMDGTLLDLAFDDFIWNHCLPERHAQVHQCSLEQSQQTLFQFYQQHKHTLSWYSSAYWTAKVGVDVLQLQYEHREKIAARAGCHQLLERLKAKGYRCWLLTNADQAGLQLKLENVELSPYFELMISSEELGHAKEDVGFWQKLQQLHPFDPAKAVFIDDTVAVLKGAEAFGISKLVSILQPSSSKPSRNVNELPYPALNHLTELFDYLESNNLETNLQVTDAKTA
ncbi:MAG TPA: haloacid dehalogenase [Acinetobacter sp.]|jgi:putative hydrolase of the HAD superfamily|uniref:GMP/IMP nucleotidase YrfG n=1 Tax=Acinetobacter venetianus TaxID=52133 RepID=A0A150HR03_9GAMM|nr:HAD-IA family hydrolase [Acinetobacter venetianus]KXO87107.1 haloacid dehalogenase [Acinetobacter venetianus]KXZ69083.1 GMP/IMP nucleotidase YrfG [Acinetobacter venetianus]HBO71434.1 haloacid dehalogenase [Acinetobacter sp.]